jgi:hypothetical protein
VLQKVKMKKEEKIKSLLAQLQSDDEEKVQLAFDEIAQTGNQADLVHLFDFLKRNPDSYASSKNISTVRRVETTGVCPVSD